MDAQAKKNRQLLTDDLLPRLLEALLADDIEQSNELISLLHKTKNCIGELLLLSVKRDLDPLEDEHSDPLLSTGDSELSDEDMNSAMLAEDATINYTPSGKTVAEALSATDTTEDLDDETRAMLAAAETPQDMSDDEAKKLLAQMDSPADMSDDEARKLLAEMDAPKEMSDDEAKKLLANMDAPQDMSDDEARKLLDAMDAPAKDLSADDEALALLQKMGGSEHEPPPAAKEEQHEPTEQLDEIEEFSKNDFASDPDMMNDFLTNSAELMETLDATILNLEQDPTNKETIESIFRAAHTLKGAAGMFGFKAIERVMHRMENLFDLVRKGTLIPDSNTIDVVFQGIDILKKLLEAVKNGKPSGTKTVPVVQALELAAKGKYVKKAAGSAPTPAQSPASSDAAEAAEKSAAHPKKKTAEQSTIKVDLERLDSLVNLVGELVIDRTRFATIEEKIRTTHPQLKIAGDISETVQLFGRHMSEIHEMIMKIRMVPIGNTFNKFTRIVRDIGRQLGKDMELLIDGEGTELDKTLVEQIGDPLIHLIRNSCDHGIELPDVRAKAGKRKTGQIWLSARQEGNHIIITIQDDGKGLPVDIIRKKAIEKGLISADAELSKREVFNLIFEPGFSTAEKVTNISGRGVGMDVVKKQISKLKGVIDLDSEQGKGTTTTIRLPLTLAIMQSLLIESQNETFAIPLSSVIESVRIKPSEIQHIGEAEVIKRHGRVLPLLYLDETLGLSSKEQHSWYSSPPQSIEEIEKLKTTRTQKRLERLYVVIVGSGENRFGIVVDQLLNQQEMVIKSLGPMMRNTPCVAGGAVLGNGEVVLVLDIQELEHHYKQRGRGKAA